MKILNTNYTITTIAVWALLFSFFIPVGALAAGPAEVDLLSAGNFAIISKTGITNTGSHSSMITGNIGSSPTTAAAMNNVFCSEITGIIYGVDAAYVGSGSQVCFAGNPPLANKTLIDNAVLDMATAYTDAAGRTLPTATELGAGNIGGLTIAPGLYKWSTSVSIPTNVTLSGGPNDVWIFQIAGDLSIASAGSVPAGVKVILAGGAKAANIYWQVGGTTGATLGTYSTFKGNILAAKQVVIQTGAVLTGRALAQTQVTLDANVVTKPGSVVNNQLGSIHGRKFEDRKNNGMVNNIDRALAGWVIYLDTNDNGVLDMNEVSTTTNANGDHHFNKLVSKIYHVREVLKPDWVQTAPVSGKFDIDLLPGTVSKNNHFLNFRPGVISGMKYEDKNSNGIKDVGDGGLAGWVITLKRVENGTTTVMAATTTNASGQYSFGNLMVGSYQLFEQGKLGWKQTDRPGRVYIYSSTVSEGNDFGNYNISSN